MVEGLAPPPPKRRSSFYGKRLSIVQSEEWKYTNVAPIARENFVMREREFDSGQNCVVRFDESRASVWFCERQFEKEASNLEALNTRGSELFGRRRRMKNYPGFSKRTGALVDYEKNGFTALNTAFVGEGAFVYLPKNSKIDAPIQILYLTEENVISHPRVLIIAEAHAEATIIETFVRRGETKYLTNAVTEISLADEAKIKHYRVQRESHNAFHISTTAAEVHRGSVYDTTAITLGARLSRHDVALKFNSEGGEAFVDGLYLLGGEQHHDTIRLSALSELHVASTYKGF